MTALENTYSSEIILFLQKVYDQLMQNVPGLWNIVKEQYMDLSLLLQQEGYYKVCSNVGVVSDCKVPEDSLYSLSEIGKKYGKPGIPECYNVVPLPYYLSSFNAIAFVGNVKTTQRRVKEGYIYYLDYNVVVPPLLQKNQLLQRTPYTDSLKLEFVGKFGESGALSNLSELGAKDSVTMCLMMNDGKLCVESAVISESGSGFKSSDIHYTEVSAQYFEDAGRLLGILNQPGYPCYRFVWFPRAISNNLYRCVEPYEGEYLLVLG